ncbi:MAG: pentapeptide repeat-containing protein [Planctomycetota bacterium]|nr:MAG: pentapeptide repeat-containing protein [Planctomycetota bacterium]
MQGVPLAIEEHLNLVRAGAAEIERWRKCHPDTQLELSGADLAGIDLAETDLYGTNFHRANLRQANLRGTDLRHVEFDQADLSGADLRQANFDYTSFRSTNLGKANLESADLGRADLRTANLTQANLKKANLRGSSLWMAELSGADLRDATLPSKTDSGPLGGFLELAATNGFESAQFSDANFLPLYVEEALNYAGQDDIPELEVWPKMVATAVANLRSIKRLMRRVEIT